jgi:hypothetical protein
MDLAAVTSWTVVPQGQAVREDGSRFPAKDLPVPPSLTPEMTEADPAGHMRFSPT